MNKIKKEAARISPKDAEAQFADALQDGNTGKYDQAAIKYRALLEHLKPQSELYDMTRYNTSWYEFRDGNVYLGALYRVESGRKLGHIIDAKITYPKPRLKAGDEIKGKKILVSSEEGAGDEILCARYASLLKAHGAAAVFWISRQGLESVLSRVEDINAAIQSEEAVHLEYDCWVFMLDLPLILKPSLSDIKVEPYLRPDPAYEEKWKSKVAAAAGLKVGIRWRGEKTRDESQKRSVSLSLLERLLNIPGVDVYSLQEGEGRDDLPLNSPINDWGKYLHTWEDTLAAISQLDLVISTDTAVAHAAGALGKEVWVISRPFSHYPWASHDDRSYWYKSARVFREPVESHWEVPFARMEMELDSKVHFRSEGSEAGRRAGEYQTVTISYPHGINLLIVIHPESELLSEIVRRRGWYTKRDLAVYDLLLKEGDVFYDIGANIGWYTLYGAIRVGTSGSVVAVEPESRNFELLSENVRRNSFLQVRLRREAVGDAVGATQLYKAPLNFGDHFTSRDTPNITGRESVEVKETTIDALTSELKRVPTLVKIDIQGAEPQALLGMQGILKQGHRPVIIVEFAPGLILRLGSSPFEVFAFIEKYGYVPYHIADDGSSSAALEKMSIQALLEFTMKNRANEVGWDLLLLPQKEVAEFEQRAKEKLL